MSSIDDETTIRVDFEDITFEKDRIAEVADVQDSMSADVLLPEHFMPQEYASSAIVRELIESFEERPNPPYKNADASLASSTIGVSLLERIAKTSPIWFLQHVDRATAVHMLQRAEPGCFVVRASTKARCLALSVRLDSSCIDHYVIEYDPTRKLMKLDGSNRTFSTIPELIHFYCKHGEELQVKLALPRAVMECTSASALHSISLMGPDFWTSELMSQTCPRVAKTIPVQRHEGRMSSGGAFGVNDSQKRLDVNDGLANGSRQYQSSTSLQRFSENESTSALNKDINLAVSRVERRTQSLRAKPNSKTNGNEPQSNDAVDSRNSHGRRSFLRNLFRSSDSRKKSTQLAHCNYFVPYSESKVQSSLSAFELGKEAENAKNSQKNSRMAPSQSVSMLTFKPSSSTGHVQPTMRRERSDLCVSSIRRLVRHQESEGSPEPATTRHTMNGSQKHSLQKCTDELKRKRLQSRNEMLQPSELATKNESHIKKEVQIPILIQPRPKQDNGMWSTLPSTIKRDHRLSVPNLVSGEESSSTWNVVSSAKALKEKLGRSNEGELLTINEGLVTPVVRRKQFLEANSSTSSSCSETSFKTDNVMNDVVRSTTQQHEKRESELVWRRQKTVDHVPITSPQNDKLKTNSALCNNWSAVNTELKSRQKIAKVRPTPKSRLTSPMTSVASGFAVPLRPEQPSRPSEYSQLGGDLSLYSRIDSEFSSHAHSLVRDDDNVSVAGTVFNEPWDSNTWDNLLDLASHGDDSTVKNKRAADVIDEEDSDSSRMHESDDDVLDETATTSISQQTIQRRTLPSDRITAKAWEDETSQYGSVRRGFNRDDTVSQRAHSPHFSSSSLQRPQSRFSNVNSGSIDDLPSSTSLLSPLLGGERRKATGTEPGAAIQQYVVSIAEDRSTVFGATLAGFIECTLEKSADADAFTLIKNVRQFINGMKNYLIRHGEGELHIVVEEERGRLNANQLLNMDMILEAVLHKLVLKPIKPHLYHLIVREHSRNGSMQSLSANFAVVRSLSPSVFVGKHEDATSSPNNQASETIRLSLRKMQSHYSPIKKLECLMTALSAMSSSMKKCDSTESTKLPPADELMRWFILMLARCSSVLCEVEAWYMWELLPKSILLRADVSFVLTVLYSAVHVLKDENAVEQLANGQPMPMISRENTTSSLSGEVSETFVKILVPDEANDTIRYVTLPAIPHCSVAKICRTIAHQENITNSEDYHLYVVAGKNHRQLSGSAVLCDLKQDLLRDGIKSYFLAYHRDDATFAWPTHVETCS